MPFFSTRLQLTLMTIRLGMVLILSLVMGVSAFAEADLEYSRIVINVPARKLTLFRHGIPVKQYPVGVGRLNFPTPEGHYKVLRKIVDPGWENPYKPSSAATRIAPGAENPLGTRWIGFKEDAGGEYGIHGTDTPASVGKFSSHGCVRMRIPDVEELFSQVAVGTPVEISYQPVDFTVDSTTIKVRKITSPFRQSVLNVPQLQQDVERLFPQFRIESQQLTKALQTSSPTAITIGTLEASRGKLLAQKILDQAPLPGDTDILEALNNTSFQDVITSSYF